MLVEKDVMGLYTKLESENIAEANLMDDLYECTHRYGIGHVQELLNILMEREDNIENG